MTRKKITVVLTAVVSVIDLFCLLCLIKLVKLYLSGNVTEDCVFSFIIFTVFVVDFLDRTKKDLLSEENNSEDER